MAGPFALSRVEPAPPGSRYVPLAFALHGLVIAAVIFASGLMPVEVEAPSIPWLNTIQIVLGPPPEPPVPVVPEPSGLGGPAPAPSGPPAPQPPYPPAAAAIPLLDLSSHDTESWVPEGLDDSVADVDLDLGGDRPGGPSAGPGGPGTDPRGDGPCVGPDCDPEGPLEVGTPGVTAPRAIFKPEPEYPESARVARVQGRVTLRAIIGLDGAIESVQVVHAASPLLVESAVETVRQWRYEPGRWGKRPVRVRVFITVDYSLK